jgi:hypothetical protein
MDQLMNDVTFADVSKAVAGPICSAIIAAIVAYFVSRRTIKFQQRAAIDGMLNKMIELSMAYPHVESDRFCQGWPEVQATEEEKGRYDQYCCFCFNALEAVWAHCSGSKKKINRIIHAKEIIHTHSRWWEHEIENLYGYSEKFRAYMHEMLDEIRRDSK